MKRRGAARGAARRIYVRFAQAAALLGLQNPCGSLVPVLLSLSSFLMALRFAWRLFNAGNLPGDPSATGYHDKMRCG